MLYIEKKVTQLTYCDRYVFYFFPEIFVSLREAQNRIHYM